MDWQTHRALRAALEWQMEAGITDVISEAPIDRFAAAAQSAAINKTGAEKGTMPRSVPATPVSSQPYVGPEQKSDAPTVDPVKEAVSLAESARDLQSLKAALAGFEHCELKKGARNLVFNDGVPGARVMIIGEAPGREEDLQGRPFVGRAGQLLDKMLVAIGLDRRETVYITNVVPWRPPQNRDPKPEEIAMMRPFMARHVALAKPDMVLLMGNISCDAGLRKRGITRLRGTWTEAYDVPAMPMFHPAYLLRQRAAKKEAWADLLAVKARLEGIS